MTWSSILTSMRRDGHIDRSFKRLLGTKQLVEVCVKPNVYQMSVETRDGRNFGNGKASTHVASVNDVALSLAKNTLSVIHVMISESLWQKIIRI